MLRFQCGTIGAVGHNCTILGVKDEVIVKFDTKDEVTLRCGL